MLQIMPYQRPRRIEFNVEEESPEFGVFVAEPFERGFATTVGNALRRTLLSTIEGAAIVAVKIEGVLHEFSSVPGVVEDVTDIILSLKTVPFKMHSKDAQRVEINVEGPATVTSKDIIVNDVVEVLDDSIHIASVGPKGSLRMEIIVDVNRGYVGAEENYDEELEIGFIPLDSSHSPIRRVKHSIGSALAGQGGYEKLSMEITTSGALSAKDALAYAASVLREQLGVFVHFESSPEDMPIKEKDEEKERLRELLERTVDELELSVRSHNCLKNANIRTIGELVQKTESEILKTKNFGRKSLNEIKEILQQMGLTLGMQIDLDAIFNKK